jgi:acyl-CoA synthetase (AMP-forming)/AMP-acid ligase II
MATNGWSFASVWQRIAQVQPSALATVHGGAGITWGDFATGAGRLAAQLQRCGLPRQGKVALYLRNGPEYMQSAFAAFSAGAVPVNVNYRYGVDEVRHICADADVQAVIFHQEFAPIAEALKAQLPGILCWICVADGSGDRPNWSDDYGAITTAGVTCTAPDIGGEDLVLIYTGGTTGMPKGVMWRQHDLYMASNTTGDPETADLDHVASRIMARADAPVGLSAAPLMHGTGFVFAMSILSRGGCLVSRSERSFDAGQVLDFIAEQRVTDMCIVGDAFARPIADLLDAKPGRWDVSSLKAISSSGMVWSPTVKQRLLRHMPETMLIDFLNSSEASGMGRSIASRRKSATAGSRFKLGRNAFVIDDDNQPIAPGDPRAGRLAVRGHIPLGYHKDPVKTAATFPVIDGVRCSVPGDFARVTEEGEIELLGRGSATINTGGEKVFAEEVEAAIKTLSGVRDALVIGIPHNRFGQVVAAAVEAPADRVTAQQVIDHVRGQLARYKAPRHVMIVDDIGRTITGKADYPATRHRLVAWLEATPTKEKEHQ